MVLAQRIGGWWLWQERCVSIPLWFSRNFLKKAIKWTIFRSFHTTMVLTQLKLGYGRPYWISCFHTTMVLTQRIRNTWSNPWKMTTFPYHYGSHATESEYLCHAWRTQFPYHYGSHATWMETWYLIFISLRFHTTMVLTQPEMQLKAIWAGLVSIPLWFSRNRVISGGQQAAR